MFRGQAANGHFGGDWEGVHDLNLCADGGKPLDRQQVWADGSRCGPYDLGGDREFAQPTGNSDADGNDGDSQRTRSDRS